MGKIYYYKLTCDNNGAPCIQDGMLSLAICKPMIRSSAEVGDWIFGFAANSLNNANPLIYVAKVTEKKEGKDYYTAEEFSKREDRVYDFVDGKFFWRSGSLHHNESNLEQDLGRYPDYSRSHVILSRNNDFRYFGKEATDTYKKDFKEIHDAVQHLGRGHRDHLDQILKEKFISLQEMLWDKHSISVLGIATSKPSCRICHRSKSLGVIA